MTDLFLFKEFCTLEGKSMDEQKGSFQIALNPDSSIFQGHFPGNPICPGVCQIEMVRECACMVRNTEMRILEVKKCRFVSVARPGSTGVMTLSVELKPTENDTYTVTAGLADDSTTYLTFSGIMKAVV